jgi:hypothetical protein
MNHHDRHNSQPSDTKKTNDDFEAKTSTIDTNEVSTKTKPKAPRNAPTSSRQERAAKISALLLKHNQLELNEQLHQITGHHAESSLNDYINSAIRDKR